MSVFGWVFADRMRPFAKLPGPAPSFPFGNALDFVGRQPWEVTADYGRTYGGIAVTWMGWSPAVVLNDPALIGEVLVTRTADFYKKAPVGALTPVITGDDPFVCNGQDWVIKRQDHPFSWPDLDGWLDAQVVPLRAALDAGAASLAQESAPLDFAPRMQRLCFDAFAAAVLGHELGDREYGWWMKMGSTGDLRMKLELGLPLPPPLNPLFYLRRTRWFGRFEAALNRALSGNSRSLDLTNWSKGGIRVRPDDRGPTPEGLVHALANVFYGGCFSATSGVVTALYLLAKHPPERTKLVAALAALGPSPSRAALEACPELDAVLREALRFYTPVPLYFRNTAPDRTVELGGTALPPDTMLMISSWLIHKDKERWGDPDAFRPARWLEGGAARDPFGSDWFFPFGRGPRTCVGQSFALLYMKLALATLATRTEVDGSGAYAQSYFFGVMMPAGLRARVTA